ncbi:nucleotidyl transferase AbiEii/AbiGii toxin family protein, partial [Amnibacterium endophyticum]
MTEAEPYRTGTAVERAISEAARRTRTAERDTNRLVREAIFDRFLCRVFADESETFLLKGGTSMLARIPTARTTRDIDLATKERTLDAAITALRAAAATDLGDHFRFEYRDTQPLLEGEGQPYTDGARIRFDTYIGAAKKDGISIDLVLGHTPTTPPITAPPANRLPLPRLATRDYRLYPLVDQVADKVCACEGLYGPTGQPSSRVKDLVDLVLIARTQTLNGSDLTRAIKVERARRALPDRDTFTAPATFGRTWRTEAAKGNLPPEIDLAAAVILVSHLIEPALTATAT